MDNAKSKKEANKTLNCVKIEWQLSQKQKSVKLGSFEFPHRKLSDLHLPDSHPRRAHEKCGKMLIKRIFMINANLLKCYASLIHSIDLYLRLRSVKFMEVGSFLELEATSLPNGVVVKTEKTEKNFFEQFSQ
ncbi:CLUMA_CG004082, isoform A [Clunio marinus]|uniref:CLUMA_CG004082, isoform A n=1 Tax=Clunio marinus TaxID=568069 RepID=A0A1J1HQJ9_9DIPT|nr:CLUMA_CG004082, isoform A [Clunio marinus]